MVTVWVPLPVSPFSFPVPPVNVQVPLTVWGLQIVIGPIVLRSRRIPPPGLHEADEELVAVVHIGDVSSGAGDASGGGIGERDRDSVLRFYAGHFERSSPGAGRLYQLHGVAGLVACVGGADDVGLLALLRAGNFCLRCRC